MKGRRRICLLDNDLAGEVGIFGNEKHIGAIDLLKEHVPLFIPAWPEGKADPDELTLQEVFDIIDQTPMHGLPISLD